MKYRVIVRDVETDSVIYLDETVEAVSSMYAPTVALARIMERDTAVAEAVILEYARKVLAENETKNAAQIVEAK